MTYTTRAFVFIGVLGATFGISVMPAAAQNPSRSFGGLFGGRSGSQQQPKQSLDLSLTVLEAYDDNILAEQGGVNPSAPAIGGWYTMFGGDGAYQWNGRRSQFGVDGRNSGSLLQRQRLGGYERGRWHRILDRVRAPDDILGESDVRLLAVIFDGTLSASRTAGAWHCAARWR